MARLQRQHRVLPIEVEEDGVGQDSVEHAAETTVSHVQDPGRMTALSWTVDKGGRRVRAVDAQAAVFEVQRLTAGSAAELEHLAAVRHVRHDRVEEQSHRLRDTGRRPSDVGLHTVLMGRERPVGRAGHERTPVGLRHGAGARPAADEDVGEAACNRA